MKSIAGALNLRTIRFEPYGKTGSDCPGASVPFPKFVTPRGRFRTNFGIGTLTVNVIHSETAKEQFE